jgi:hypothetical protein
MIKNWFLVIGIILIIGAFGYNAIISEAINLVLIAEGISEVNKTYEPPSRDIQQKFLDSAFTYYDYSHKIFLAGLIFVLIYCLLSLIPKSRD